MKTIVFDPRAARPRRASSISALMSLIDDDVAENVTNRACVVRAMMRASVVFPDPGGPQKIIDGMRSFSMALRRNRPGARRSARPTMSASDVGRSRSASGESARAVSVAGGKASSSNSEPVLMRGEC